MTLLDKDINTEYTENRENLNLKIKILNKSNFPNDFDDFKSKIVQINNWKVNLFTSGTTGNPKKITHNYESITRFVKRSNRHSNDIWGLAYNPTHIAGLQVIMQALLNGNSMIRLFELSKHKVYEQISKYNISHISATPTFYRLILPTNKKYRLVKKISSGGEAFTQQIKRFINDVFPNADIYNIYASTEAGTLFAADGEFFTIKDHMKKFIKIISSEIAIHKSLIGETDSKINEWYKTGDLVEIINNNPLKFKIISRKTSIINIAGLNVNPNEVESVIKSIKGISEALVYPKQNNVTGNILCCDLKVNNKIISELEIRKILINKLPKYKIPIIFNFVNKMKLTRTGKLSRI